MAVKKKDIDFSAFDAPVQSAPVKKEIDFSSFDTPGKKKEPTQKLSASSSVGVEDISPSTSQSPLKEDWSQIEQSIVDTRDKYDIMEDVKLAKMRAGVGPGGVVPVNRKFYDSYINQASNDFTNAQKASNELIKSRSKELMQPVQDLFKTDKWKQYFDESGNFKSDEARSYFDAEVKKRGGGQFLREQLVYAFKNAGQYKMDEPDRTKFREEEYKKAGLDLGKYGERLIKAETKMQRQGLDMLTAETKEKGNVFLQDNIKPRAVEIGRQYTEKLEELKAKVASGEINPEASEGELKVASELYKKSIANLDKEYKNGIRDINVKAQDKYARLSKEYDQVVSSLTEDRLLKLLTPEELEKKKKADEAVELRIAKGKNAVRMAQDKIAGLATGNNEFGGILSKSIISGWNRGLSNLGDYISSKGYDNSFSRWLQSRDYQAEVFSPAQYEYGEDTMKRIVSSTGTSLGASAPILIPAVGVSVASGGLGLPEIATVIGAGATSFVGESAMNTGEVYKNMLEKTGSATIAYQKAREFEDKQKILMPLYFLEGAGLQKLIKGGGISKAATGTLQELGQELPTEYWQGFTQEQVQNDYKKSFGSYIKENPETALDVIAGTIGQSGILSAGGHIFNKINENIPNNQSQYFVDMVHKQGVPFALENLQKQFDTGVIDEEQLKKGQEIINRASQKIKDLDAAGIKGHDAQAYISLSDDINKLTDAAEKSQDDGLTKLYEAKADEKRKELEAIAKGEGVYAVIDMPGGTNATKVIPASSLEQLKSEGRLDDVIKNADKITVVNDEKLNTELNERKGQLGNPIDAPEGFYKNDQASEKSTSLKLFEKAYEKGGTGIKETLAQAVNDDQKSEAVQFLMDQAVDTPAGLRDQLGGDTRLTTDLIAQNKIEDIQSSIDKYESEMQEDGLSEQRMDTLDKHLDLLYKGLEKKQKQDAAISESTNQAVKKEEAEATPIKFPARNDDFVGDRRYFSEQEEARYWDLVDMGKQKEAQQLITAKKEELNAGEKAKLAGETLNKPKEEISGVKGNEVSFKTHKNEIVSGEKLNKALNEVADDWANLQRKIREEDKYAKHITEKQKDDALVKGLERAEEIRNGKNIDNFTIWQRINEKLTGESIALMPDKNNVSQAIPKIEESTRTQEQTEGEPTINVESVKPKDIFTEFESAISDKKSNKLRNDSIDAIAKKYGKMGEKAAMIEKNFSDITRQLKESNKIEIKC